MQMKLCIGSPALGRGRVIAIANHQRLSSERNNSCDTDTSIRYIAMRGRVDLDGSIGWGFPFLSPLEGHEVGVPIFGDDRCP